MNNKFLKLHSVELNEGCRKRLGELFLEPGVESISNVNQYVKNGEKNAVKLSELKALKANLCLTDEGFSIREELDFATENQMNLFDPLNSSSISSESIDFIKSCYPEYYSISKKDALFYRHENECCIIPEVGKSFYVRNSAGVASKYKPEEIFPRQIGFAYNLEEGQRVYKGFGYHKFKQNSEEVKFEGLRLSASPDEPVFLAEIQPDFGRVFVSLADLPEDRFVYLPLGDIVKEDSRVRVFNWSGNRA